MAVPARGPARARPVAALLHVRDPHRRRVADVRRRRRGAARRGRRRVLVLGEPVSAPLVVGALLIVGGGVALIVERRPEHLRASGLVLAGICTLLFAARDNLVRHLSGTSAVPPTVAAAATLAVGAVVATAYARRAPGRTALGVFAPAGLCFGLSYVCLFEAYYRGRVSVVSPLVATETLWGVGLSALLLRRTELVGGRLVAGAALIVARRRPDRDLPVRDRRRYMWAFAIVVAALFVSGASGARRTRTPPRTRRRTTQTSPRGRTATTSACTGGR